MRELDEEGLDLALDVWAAKSHLLTGSGFEQRSSVEIEEDRRQVIGQMISAYLSVAAP